MGLVCLFCWFSRRFLENQTKTSGKPKIQNKTKENQKHLRENQQNKNTLGKTNKQKNKNISKGGSETFKNFDCWFSRMCFWFSLVFFSICGFPEGLFGFLKTFGKTKKTQNNKPISKGGSETFKNFVVLVFPKVLLFFVGFLWYCWFSRRFLGFSKNLRENQTNKKNKPISKPVG